jgi:membrane protease YdiL (CAAX protease family)
MASDEQTVTDTVTEPLAAPRDDTRRLAVTVIAIVAAITVSEALLFTGRNHAAIWGHFVTLFGCLYLIRRAEGDTPVLMAFALVPVFRLVNLGMPVFFQLTVYWFPLIYGPLIPAVVMVDNMTDVDVPMGLKRGALLAPFTIPLGLVLAEWENVILQSEALIPEWSALQLLMITVVMVFFVGFVEEYLFRGLLQGALEAEFGRWPGLLLTSAVFGLMHSGYGLYAEIAFAGFIGLVFGLIYDYLDSLVLITLAHGFLNVFLFAVLPIQGSVLPLP